MCVVQCWENHWKYTCIYITVYSSTFIPSMTRNYYNSWAENARHSSKLFSKKAERCRPGVWMSPPLPFMWWRLCGFQKILIPWLWHLHVNDSKKSDSAKEGKRTRPFLYVYVLFSGERACPQAKRVSSVPGVGRGPAAENKAEPKLHAAATPLSEDGLPGRQTCSVRCW